MNTDKYPLDTYCEADAMESVVKSSMPKSQELIIASKRYAMCFSKRKPKRSS